MSDSAPPDADGPVPPPVPNRERFRFAAISPEVVEGMRSDAISHFLERERASRAASGRVSEDVILEQRDFVDMTRRTQVIADRNGLARPDIFWMQGNDAEAGVQNNRQTVHYGNEMIRSLSGAARDFIAAHEIWHTTPQNLEMLELNRRRGEYLADEFAARQPGATLEAAREVFSLREGDHSTHPTNAERLRNIERVIRERDQGAAISQPVADTLPALPGSVPVELRASLEGIAQNLRGHQQQARQVSEGPTTAGSVPAPEFSSEVRGLA